MLLWAQGVTRILVAGLGLIGARHAQAVAAHPHAELAAVVDPRDDLRRCYDAPGFRTLADVDVPVDAAILATPSNLHADHAVVCLDCGWPCLIEKPIEVSLDAADRIVAASHETGLPVLTGHHRRYHASVERLRAVLADGAIGQPVLASAIWAMKKQDAYFQGTWRDVQQGSPVMINMVHDIDLMRYLLGEVVEVSALGGDPVRGAGRIESGVIALRFDSGATASIAFADTTPSPWGFEAGTGENPNIATTGQDCLWIAGTNGGVAFPSLTLWGGARDWSEAPEAAQVQAPKTVPLDAQLDHFLDVLDGAPPRITAEDARASLAVTLEVQRQITESMRP